MLQLGALERSKVVVAVSEKLADRYTAGWGTQVRILLERIFVVQKAEQVRSPGTPNQHTSLRILHELVC